MMRVYRIYPEYTADLEHYAHWVDDALVLNDTPHRRVGPVSAQWPTDLAFSLVPQGHDCDILFNPQGLIYSARVKQAVCAICDQDVEWLPVHVAPIGTMYLLHPIHSVPLGSKAKYRQHRPGSNIVEIYEYDFDTPELLPSCFLIPQSLTSPAGKIGYSTIGTYVTHNLYRALSAFRGVDFACVFKPIEPSA